MRNRAITLRATRLAFTLIELLVVIGIIALLASIAMPAYRTVQEKAGGIKDASNLKQLGVGLIAYLNDHDDTMFSTASTSGSNSWSSQIGPIGTANYVSDWRAFQSPFDHRPFVTTANANVSYGMNEYILSGTTASTTSYHYPSSLMVLGPSETANGTTLKFAGTTTSNVTVTPGRGISGVMSNLTLLNVLFMDGHTETLKATNFNLQNYNPGPGNGQSMFWQPSAE
jgi:prepilin-type N-terminal cleavage/methylation domain-containing protein/prepilin-type processing-associated H-X9-DG protein